MQVMPFLEALLDMMPILGRVALLVVATAVGLHNNGMHVLMEPLAGWLIHVTSPYTDPIASFAMAWSVMPVVVRWID